jgi:hypothetical protein
MRCVAVILRAVLMAGWAGGVEARDTSITEFPKDAWDLAFMWTEPMKHVAKETRRFDPLSGLWFGLLEGSIKSVERTAEFLLQEGEERSGQPVKSGKPILRYSF